MQEKEIFTSGYAGRNHFYLLVITILAGAIITVMSPLFVVPFLVLMGMIGLWIQAREEARVHRVEKSLKDSKPTVYEGYAEKDAPQGYRGREDGSEQYWNGIK